MYIREQSINPEIPDTYMAVAVNDTTFKDAIVGISDNISRKDLLLGCPIIITLSALTIVGIVLCLCGFEKYLKKEYNVGLSNQTKSTILSLTLISLGKLIAFIWFDSSAIYFGAQTNSQTIDIKYLNDSVVGFVQAMHNVPVILLVFDLFALILNLGLIAAAIARAHFKSQSPTGNKKISYFKAVWAIKDVQYYFLALTLVLLSSSCIIHAPYIIMAYVSDASYASSIFVYYMAELFMEFSLNQYTFSVYLEYVIIRKSSKCKYVLACLLACLLAVVFAVMINGLMITIFLYFYFLPIKYILNNGPSQFVLIYQSGVLFVGGYLTYKAVIRKESNEMGNALRRQLKENEIAILESEIVEKQMNLESNDQIKLLQKKIIHLRKEIELISMHEMIMCAFDGQSNNIDIPCLQDQQKRVINYLIKERNDLGDHTDPESKRIEGEILAHSQNVITQIRREPDKQQDLIKKLWKCITSIPSAAAENKTRLQDELSGLLYTDDAIDDATDDASDDATDDAANADDHELKLLTASPCSSELPLL